MAFELYFNVSKTAIEILAIATVAAAGVYIAKDLMKEEEEEIPKINPVIRPYNG